MYGSTAVFPQLEQLMVLMDDKETLSRRYNDAQGVAQCTQTYGRGSSVEEDADGCFGFLSVSLLIIVSTGLDRESFWTIM
jgi:hypothetical protein